MLAVLASPHKVPGAGAGLSVSLAPRWKKRLVEVVGRTSAPNSPGIRKKEKILRSLGSNSGKKMSN